MGFLKAPFSWIAAPAKSDEPQRVPETKSEPHSPGVDPTPPVAVTRDFLSEWNAVVPDAFTEHEPRRKVNIEPEFVAAFDKICEVARGIRKNKPDSTWLTFYYLFAIKDGHTRENWKRLITDMRGMAASKSPESGQTDDEERYQNWKIGKGLPRSVSEKLAWATRAAEEDMAEEPAV